MQRPYTQSSASEVESLLVPTILCIDKHSPTLQTLCWLFEANGYRCLTAPDGEEALQLFEQGAVDLVVLDHILDQESEAELAGTLKKMPKALLTTTLSLIVRSQTVGH